MTVERARKASLQLGPPVQHPDAARLARDVCAKVAGWVFHQMINTLVDAFVARALVLAAQAEAVPLPAAPA